MINKTLIALYKINHGAIRTRLLNYIAEREGGQPHSVTIRNIFTKYHQVNIGMYSYGGCFTPGYLPEGTQVGRYCSFASEFAILNGNHPARFKSLHPFFYNPVFGYVNSLLITRTKLVIENDVWIGARFIVLPGCSHIGKGVIIGAGSVVTKDIPDYAVVGGNPAKVLKYRKS